MTTDISVRGYTNVLLSLDMRHFIAPNDQNRFENIRGTKEFAEVLRGNWYSASKQQKMFISDTNLQETNDEKVSPSDEDIGFAAGGV